MDPCCDQDFKEFGMAFGSGCWLTSGWHDLKGW